MVDGRANFFKFLNVFFILKRFPNPSHNLTKILNLRLRRVQSSAHLNSYMQPYLVESASLKCYLFNLYYRLYLDWETGSHPNNLRTRNRYFFTTIPSASASQERMNWCPETRYRLRLWKSPIHSRCSNIEPTKSLSTGELKILIYCYHRYVCDYYILILYSLYLSYNLADFGFWLKLLT